eukprot:gene13215-19051_t
MLTHCSIAVSRAKDKQMVFQGGCYKDLHRMLNIESGNQIMYVGDHIYGDIVKSKKTIGWRTMSVYQEQQLLRKHRDLLDDQRPRYSVYQELQLYPWDQVTVQSDGVQCVLQSVYQELQLLRKHRDLLDDQIQRYEWAVKQGNVPKDPEAYAKNLEMLGDMRSRRDKLKMRHTKLLADHHSHFHPVWGQLLKTGHQNSRFAHQLERFACLYTSHVSNLAFNSPDKSYMGRMDYMAHEDYHDFGYDEPTN